MTHFSGDRLRAIRRAAQQSRDSVAVRARMSGSAVTRYEQGRSTPSVDAAARLAEALGVEITEFFDGVDGDAHDIGSLPPWAQRLIADLQTGANGRKVRQLEGSAA